MTSSPARSQCGSRERAVRRGFVGAGAALLATALGGGPDAAFDVTAEVGSRSTVLHYQVTDWESPRRVVLEASKPWMRLHDEIVIDRVATDTLITYDARITLRGPLKVFDKLLDKRFRAVGRATCAKRGFDRRGFFEVDSGKKSDWTQSLSN